MWEDKQTTNFVAFSPQAKYTDRATATAGKVVQILLLEGVA
jgi:hypothetical protein